MEKLLGAVIIAKNEADVIQKTLESLEFYVDAITVLVDNSSTDKTYQICEKFPKTRALYGNFKDYAQMRNDALHVASQRNPTIFTLTMSADEKLVGGAELRAFLENHREYAPGTNSFCIMMRADSRQWPFPRVLRTEGGWKYVNSTGGRHEQPVPPMEGESVGPLIPDVFVVHAESNPRGKLASMREKDLPELTAVVEDDSKSLSERLEPLFQLAETHFRLGHNDRNEDGTREVGGRWLTDLFASMAYFNRYAEIAEVFSDKMKETGDENHKFLFQRAMYARYMYLQVAETFGLFEPSELVKRVMMITRLCPQIPEAHFLLAKNAAKVDVRKAIPLAMQSAKIANAIYKNPVHGATDISLEWKSLLLAADCAKVVKDTRLQQSFAKQALAAGAPKEMVGDLAGQPS